MNEETVTVVIPSGVDAKSYHSGIQYGISISHHPILETKLSDLVSTEVIEAFLMTDAEDKLFILLDERLRVLIKNSFPFVPYAVRQDVWEMVYPGVSSSLKTYISKINNDGDDDLF